MQRARINKFTENMSNCIPRETEAQSHRVTGGQTDRRLNKQRKKYREPTRKRPLTNLKEVTYLS